MELAVPQRPVTARHLRVLTDPTVVDTESPTTPLDVEIVIPVYNEAAILDSRIRTLRTFLDQSFPFETLVTIVDNGSRDGTAMVAADLAATLPGVAAIHLDRKGRGFALRSAWSASQAKVVAYMDVDLSTSLTGLLPLVAPLLSEHRRVAIGTRLDRDSRVVRGPKREVISRIYNLLLRIVLRSRVSDAQCGFKALERETALELLPLIEDNEWFFDTELLVTAKRLGHRVWEVPVDWVDDTDSRVDILPTILDDLRGMLRLFGPRARARIRRHRRA
jgi:glycosyltransferase involved in cell wall biosynthesis